MLSKQWKDSMSGRARDDFQAAGVLELAKNPNKITVTGNIEVANGSEALKIKSRELVEWFFPMRAKDFFLSQFDETIEMLQIALLKQWIQQHRAKRWGKCQREREPHSIILPP